MKQFLISVIILLFRCCLAPHFRCTVEKPFSTKYNDCQSFKDICTQYRSEDCQAVLRACNQCPLSNLTIDSLRHTLRLYIDQDKNCSQTKHGTMSIQKSPSLGFISQNILEKSHSQTRNETKSVQEYPTNQLMWIILGFLTLLSTLNLACSIYQCIINKMKSEKPIEIGLSWIDAKDGLYPSGAIEVADSCIIIRAKHGDEYIPGLLIKGHKFALISYGDKAIQINSYQVLVDTSIFKKPIFEWNYACGENIPSGAIIGGTDNGKPLYIAKGVIEGKYVVGKFQPELKCAYFPVEPNEIMESGLIRVLCHAKT